MERRVCEIVGVGPAAVVGADDDDDEQAPSPAKETNTPRAAMAQRGCNTSIT